MKEIESMRDLFYRAHCATSFSPDARAKSCVDDFSMELQADLLELGGSDSYKAKYLAHLSKWASRKSRCMSSMITGPANFPFRSNEKHMNSERNAWEEFRAWRERYIKRANSEKTKSPEEDLDIALADLDKARIEHDKMIRINKIIRMKISTEEKIEKLSSEIGLQERTINNVLSEGIPGFTLTNHNAKLKRLEEKILTMKSRIERKQTFEKIVFSDGSIDIENDRVVIRHDQKPEKDIIDRLKQNGFRWSPHWSCWCRKHTAAALAAAKNICLISKESNS